MAVLCKNDTFTLKRIFTIGGTVMTTSLGAILASKNRRKIIRAFKNAGAVSPESAKSLDSLGLAESVMFKIQRRKGVIVQTEAALFYLDKERAAAGVRFRLAVLFAAIILLIVLLFISK